jgi:uncharacterized cupredoxin-like copper-binding protein
MIMSRFLACTIASFMLALGLATLVAAQGASPTPTMGACATPAASPGASPAVASVTAVTPSPSASASPMASPTAAGCVTVSEKEFKIDMPTTLPAGTTTFEVTNHGTIAHSFEIEGQGIEKRLAQPLQPGQSATLTVDLKPGAYEAYCPVDGHKGMGMDVHLTVK